MISFNTLENHFGAILSLLIFVITQAAIIARSIWLTAQTARKVDHLEKMLAEHISSSTLHRTPDFEIRLNHLNDVIEEIRTDVKELLKKE